MTLQSRIRLGAHISARNEMRRHENDMAIEEKKRTRLIGDEYGFLRALNQGYYLGEAKDPHALLPTQFPNYGR